MPPNVILFFVKHPTPGKVKTRLAKTVGIHEAARMYRELAEQNLAVIAPLHSSRLCEAVVVYDPPGQEADLKRWLAFSGEYWPQCEGELGERLIASFGDAFRRGGRRVIALGSDTLGLTSGIVQQGFEALHSCDVVLGPAEDGGYYLIGSSGFQPGLFQGISWSTDAVLRQTCAQISQLGLNHQTLEQLEDLDEMKER